MNRLMLIKTVGLYPLSLVGRLAADFFQEDFILSLGNSNTNVLVNRMKSLSQSKSGITLPVYAIYAGGDCVFIQSMKETSPLMDSLSKELSPEQRDYRVLTEGILQSILALTPEQLNNNFVQGSDLAAALEDVEEGRYQYLFIMNN